MKGIKLVPNKPLTEIQKLKVDNTMLRQEVASLKKQLRIGSVSQQRELLKAFQDHYQSDKFDDERTFDWNINNFLKAFNCG